MTTMTLGLGLVLAYVAASVTYVYAYRGTARHGSLSEYFRKGWPIFTPINCFLYIFSQRRARRPILKTSEYPELAPITENWETIRDEVMALFKAGYFEQTKKTGSQASFDIGFRTFFKYGWSKFYLKWYGYTHESAKELCPKTVAIISKIPSVNGAMFSLLPPGGQLTRHLDPVACSLRYHLGLSTPNSESCFINVDGQAYSWKDGEAFMFDETYLHFARNDASTPRLILMCDVDRPMNSIIGKIFNWFIRSLMSLSIVPNVQGDKVGVASKIFSSLSPILAKSKNLKQTNRKAYLLLKYTVNFTLFLIAVALIAGVFRIIGSFF